MSADLPRVLFFTSEIPQSVNAGSMQLFRSMQGYPDDRLMVLGVAPESGATLLPGRYATTKLLTYRLACTRFRGWFSGFNALLTAWEPQLGRSLRLARAFRPELIVTVMDKLSYYKHAWALSRRLRVPLLTITMDDPQTFEQAHPSLEFAFRRLLRRIYRDASLSLGVSNEMCEYLAAEFGRRSQVFYFGAPEGIPARATEASRSLKQPPHLTLGYAGSLGLGYREGLTALLETLTSTGTRLHLYTKDQHCLINHPQISNRGFHPSSELWPLVQAECDAVLMPYAFGGEITRVYRTHFPTKLSEYCRAGLPLLVVGPEYATGVRWAQRHPDAALVATAPDLPALGEPLGRLRADADLRVRLAAGALAAGEAEFEPRSARNRFQDLLRAAANSTVN